MKKLILTVVTLGILIHLSSAQAMSKHELQQRVKKNHVALSYSDTKKVLFSTVENKDGLVCSVYTENQCQKRHHKPMELVQLALKKQPRGFRLNVEHTWPQSKGAKKLPANSDMHHLFVTSKESNSKRANLPFCKVESIFWEFGGSLQGIDYYSQDCFEPRDIHKGNVARAMFYFSVRYMMKIDEDQESVLRSWHIIDPVDDAERQRNLMIEKLQGNLNPFIVDESLVEQITDY